MYFVNVVNMKIPITIFICISISSAGSTGSNSSLLESKKFTNSGDNGNLGLQFKGYIVVQREKHKRVATATFINQCNCLIARFWARKIDKKDADYLAETPAFLERKKYQIHDVLYKNVDDDIAAYWGVAKLEKHCEREQPYFTFINSRLPEFKMNESYYVGAWIFRRDIGAKPRYSKLQLIPFSPCRLILITEMGEMKHNLACAHLQEGYFVKTDIGTGLFLNKNELLGVVVQVPGGAWKYTICALLHNDERIIHNFVNYVPEACRRRDKGVDEGKGKGKAPAESSDVYFEPPGGAGTPCLPDTNLENPGHMDASGKGQMMVTYHQGRTNAYNPYNPNPMGTYQRDNTYAYDPSPLAAWNQEQMGALNPNPMGTHHQGQTGSYNLSHMGTYGQGQMDSHHRSEIDSHQPSYMNPQYATNIADLTRLFQSPKPVKTRGNQSPRGHQVHDGSRTAHPFRSVYPNPDVQKQRPILDTSRVIRKKPSRNPRTRSEHPKK